MTFENVTAKAIRSGITTSVLVAVALTIAAYASFQGNGVQIEAGGVAMTLKASTETGLQLVFAAVT